MRKIVLVFVLTCSLSIFSQEENTTLLTIDKEKTTVGEFKKMYEKDLNAIGSEDSKDVISYLELFINYKLKVKEAYQIQLDTLPSYKRELEMYKNQLSIPYLKDTTSLKTLVEEAYFRTKNEIKAKHILVRMSINATPKDTLEAYNKILKIRNRIINGEDFEKVAVEVSDDKSAQDDPKTGRKGNKGNLGYFSAFRMVYPFEKAAYSTKVGEISTPFKTNYGYHIVKVDDLRLSKGELEVAHILITDTTAQGKAKIDVVFSKLQQNEKFENLAKNYSEDTTTKEKGGKLMKFGRGVMVKPFEDVAFALEKEGKYSKPFKTRFGWHIVKLLKKHPVKTFEEEEQELTNKIKKSSRMQLSEKAVITKLKKQYIILENEDAKKILNRKNLRAIPKDSLQNVILSINEKNITQEKFINYILNRRHLPIFSLFEMFKDTEIITYYKENLEDTAPEYAATVKEYKEGLLLFELMQQKVWDKSAKDSIGLKQYFKTNKNNYQTKDLESIKGKVMNDYQNFLEKKWIADLRKKSHIEVNKRQLKKLVEFYDKK